MSDKLVLNLTLKDPALIEIPKWAIPTLGRLKDARVKITVEKYRKRRSLSQNAYYMAVVVPAVQRILVEAGNAMDEEDTHEFLKDEVGKLNRVVVLPDGEVKRMRGSTKDFGTMQFEDYLDKCRAFAAEQGVIIPLPNENLEVSA